MSDASSWRLGRLADLPALILFACLLCNLPNACGDAGAVATLAKQHATVGSAAVSGALPPRAQRQASDAFDFTRRGEEKGADVDLDIGVHDLYPTLAAKGREPLAERRAGPAASTRTRHPRDPPQLA